MLKALLKIRDNLEEQLEGPHWKESRADNIKMHRDVNLMVVEAGGHPSDLVRSYIFEQDLAKFHGGDLLH